MRKIFLVVLSLFLLPAMVHAAGFSLSKKAGDVTVEVSMAGQSPAVGKNMIALELTGANGTPITDAEVVLDYFMPSMPAMKYRSTAQRKGTGYTAELGLAMAGQWDVAVSFRRPGGEMQKITFSVNAK
ncbi:MAG: hypothetical protein GXO94_03730 [Nitrospirae bacterium]|nr:hypothetical protein [Nitrospirota bacterium]